MSANILSGLPSEYWALHRNSLLFSSALFITCLIDSSTDVAVLGMDFQGVSIRQLGFLLLVASCYATFTLYMEWRSETRSVYYGRNGRHRDLKERLEVAEAGIKTFSEDATALANENRNLAKALQGGAHVARLAPIVERITRNFKDRSTMLRQNDEANFRVGACREPVRGTMGRVWGQAERELEAVLRGLEQGLETEQLQDTNSIIAALSAVADDFEKTVAHHQRIIRQNRWLYLNVNFEIFLDWVRLAGISLFVPVVTFLVAVIHYAGSVGFALMESPILKFISSLR